MRTSRIHPILYIILGLIAGILIGLYYGNNNKKLESSVIILKKDNTINKIDKIEKPIKKAPKKRKKKSHHIKRKIVKVDSIIKDTSSILVDTTSIIDSTLSKPKQDSITSDTILTKMIDDTIIKQASDSNSDSINNEDIIVAQDELIYSEYITPQGKKNDFLCKYDIKLDSILTNNIVTRDHEGIYVEFWRSPLNSTGYKLNHNTLVLFGFYQYKSVNLKYLKNGRLRISYLSNNFEVTCSDEFKTLQLSK